jgi:predicted dehydrogenase
MSNYHPYNWHWFKHWGTGGRSTPGTHEIDVCRWILGVDYPQPHYLRRPLSVQGRLAVLHTLVTSFEYDDKIISWEASVARG